MKKSRVFKLMFLFFTLLICSCSAQEETGPFLQVEDITGIGVPVVLRDRICFSALAPLPSENGNTEYYQPLVSLALDGNDPEIVLTVHRALQRENGVEILSSCMDMVVQEDGTILQLVEEISYPAEDGKGPTSPFAEKRRYLDILELDGTRIKRIETVGLEHVNFVCGGILLDGNLWCASGFTIVEIDVSTGEAISYNIQGDAAMRSMSPLQHLRNEQVLLLGKDVKTDVLTAEVFDTELKMVKETIPVPEELVGSGLLNAVRNSFAQKTEEAVLWNDTGIYQWKLKESEVVCYVTWADTEADVTNLKHVVQTGENNFLAISQNGSEPPQFTAVSGN